MLLYWAVKKKKKKSHRLRYAQPGWVLCCYFFIALIFVSSHKSTEVFASVHRTIMERVEFVAHLYKRSSLSGNAWQNSTTPCSVPACCILSGQVVFGARLFCWVEVYYFHYKMYCVIWRKRSTQVMLVNLNWTVYTAPCWFHLTWTLVMGMAAVIWVLFPSNAHIQQSTACS